MCTTQALGHTWENVARVIEETSLFSVFVKRPKTEHMRGIIKPKGGAYCLLLSFLVGSSVTTSPPPLALPIKWPGLNNTNCGLRPLVDYPTSRIIGGKTARDGAWPWQVSLEHYALFKGYEHICGGSVISEIWLLSAAHCFRKAKSALYWRAILGLRTLYTPSASTVVRSIQKIIVKSDFHRETMVNDIALLRLKVPIVYSAYIQPICIPNNPEINISLPCFISGWGRTTEGGSISRFLKEAQVDIIPTKICNQQDWYAGIVHDTMICAGFERGGIDSCQGDSGGPFACFFSKTKSFYQLGVTSFGYGCGHPRNPGIYTHVASYRNWIENVIQTNNRNHIEPLLHHMILLTVGKLILF
ncbi:transmembrane protease serine 12-like [Lissotriton helveticus]